MFQFDAMGACGNNNAVGCPPPAYNRYAANYGYPYPYNQYAMQGPVSWDIVGQAPPVPAPVPAQQPGVVDRVREWGARRTVAGIPNGWLLGGALAATGIWAAYGAGYLGGSPARARGRDFDYALDF